MLHPLHRTCNPKKRIVMKDKLILFKYKDGKIKYFRRCDILCIGSKVEFTAESTIKNQENVDNIEHIVSQYNSD